MSVWQRPEELAHLQQPSLCPHRHKGSGDKGVVPEPGGYAGAEAYKQDHRPARGLLQARPSPSSVWYVDSMAGRTKSHGEGVFTYDDTDGKNG